MTNTGATCSLLCLRREFMETLIKTLSSEEDWSLKAFSECWFSKTTELRMTWISTRFWHLRKSSTKNFAKTQVHFLMQCGRSMIHCHLSSLWRKSRGKVLPKWSRMSSEESSTRLKDSKSPRSFRKKRYTLILILFRRYLRKTLLYTLKHNRHTKCTTPISTLRCRHRPPLQKWWVRSRTLLMKNSVLIQTLASRINLKRI